MLPRFVKSHCVKYHHVSPPLTAYTIMRLLDLIGYCLDPCKSMRELAPHCPSLMDITVGYLGISWDTLWGILWPHEPSDEVANMQQRIEQHPAGPKWSNCNTDSFQARPLKLGKLSSNIFKHAQTQPMTLSVEPKLIQTAPIMTVSLIRVVRGGPSASRRDNMERVSSFEAFRPMSHMARISQISPKSTRNHERQ